MQHQHRKNFVSRYIFNPITILLFLVAISVIGIITTPAKVHATNVSDMNPVDSATSYVLFNALAQCISTTGLDVGTLGHGVSPAAVDSGNWFRNYTTGSTNPRIGNYLTGANTGLKTGKIGAPDENVGCGGVNTDWITYAAKLWGYTNKELFCAAGGVRDGGAPCLSGGTEKYDGPSHKLDVNTFRTSVISKIGDPSIGISDATRYALYNGAFQEGCLGPGHQDPWTTPKQPGDTNFYSQITIVADDGTYPPANYVGKRPPSATIYVYIDQALKDKSMTCSDLAKGINATAGYYSTWIKNNGPITPTPTPTPVVDPTSDKSCGAQNSGLGWIICPVLRSLTSLDDGMWKIVSSLLNVNPITQSGSIYEAWGSIRSIANVVFVIFFLVIIFSQLTGAGITNYGVKKMLPKIIIAAILVNVSFIIIQLAVDLANIIGSSLYGFIVSMAPHYTVNWGSELNLLEGVGGGLGVGIIGVAAAGGIGALFFILLGLALISALGLITAVLTLIFRQAAIIIIIILAPLAFVAYLLPNTETWFKKWRGLLMSMLMMYPMAALVFAGSQFAAATIIDDGTDFWKILIGLTMMALPLFSLPFLARQGGPILSRVNGALAGVAKRANQPIRDISKSYSDRSAERFRANNANQRGGVLGGFQRVGRGLSYPSRHLSRAWSGGRQTREAQTETAKSEFKSQLSNNQVRGTFGRRINGEATDVAAAAAKKNLGIDEANTTERLKQQNPMVNARHSGIPAPRPGEPDERRLNEREYASNLRKETTDNSVKQGLENNQSFNALRTSADHAKSGAETATDEAKQRVDADPTTLQVRATRTRAAEGLASQETHTKAVISTASTKIDPNNPDITPIELEALAIDAGTRGDLVANKLAQDIENNAEGQAQAAQGQEIAEVYLEPDDPSTGFVNQAVIAAAGKGGRQGQAIVQAGSTQKIETERQKNITAAKTIHSALQYTSADLMDTVRGTKRTSRPGMPLITAPASIEDQIAAASDIVDIGQEEGFDALLARAADPGFSATPEGVLFQQNLAKQIGASPKKPKYVPGPVLGELASGTFRRLTGASTFQAVTAKTTYNPADELVYQTALGRKLSKDSFKGMDIDEMKRMTRVLSDVATSGTPIDPAIRAELRDIIDAAEKDPRINEKWGDREFDEMTNIFGALM